MRYFKDLFLTDDFLIRGHVSTGGRRLSNFLNAAARPFIEVGDATVITAGGEQPVAGGRSILRLSEILLAHELSSEAGDESLRALAERGAAEVAVSMILKGRTAIELSGTIRRTTWERDAFGQNAFVVVGRPQIRGLEAGGPGSHPLLQEMDYVIVNTARVALVSGEDSP